MQARILSVDASGTPLDWIEVERAAKYYAEDLVAYELGDRDITVLHGGINRATGEQSLMLVAPIIGVRGRPNPRLATRVPTVTRHGIFKRDRETCAYCGERFNPSVLEAEHIVPASQGGPWSWMNLVASCRFCNQKKGNRTPDQAGMRLLYVPYVPNRYEGFILQGRRILADQMEFLRMGLPAHSRLV